MVSLYIHPFSLNGKIIALNLQEAVIWTDIGDGLRREEQYNKQLQLHIYVYIYI